MDVSNRTWWIRVGEKEEGPIEEEAFQERLRAGKIPLQASIKSNQMTSFEPLLTYISKDETFRRPSKMPRPQSAGDKSAS